MPIPPRAKEIQRQQRYQAKKVKPKKPQAITKPFKDMAPHEIAMVKAITVDSPTVGSLIDKAKRGPRKQYEHFSSDGAGNIKRTDTPPKDGYFKAGTEGRIKGIMPKRKIAKLKPEVWSTRNLQNFFHSHQIHADNSKGWFITFNTPSRKMTAADQLYLMLENSTLMHDVYIDRVIQHLVIDKLEGTEE